MLNLHFLTFHIFNKSIKLKLNIQEVRIWTTTTNHTRDKMITTDTKL